jgi:hypothetical protein
MMLDKIDVFDNQWKGNLNYNSNNYKGLERHGQLHLGEYLKIGKY